MSPTVTNVQENGNNEWKQKDPAGRPEVSKLQQLVTNHSPVPAPVPGHNMANGHSSSNGTASSSMQQPASSDTTNGSHVNTNQALEVNISLFITD